MLSLFNKKQTGNRGEYAFEESPNPDAKIAFVMWTPFHFYVYKNIAKHLPESEFVIADTSYMPLTYRGGKHIQDSVDTLKEAGCYWRVILERKDRDTIARFFDRYEVIVSVLLSEPLDSLRWETSWLQKKKAVRINYGVGKDLSTFAPWSAYFDITLTDGRYTHQYLKHLSNSYIVGVPKFDDWFNKTIDEDLINRVQKLLDPAKKTVLYLPTHGGLSSLYKFGSAVRDLSGGYNLLVKFHHHNFLSETKIVKEFQTNQKIFTFSEKDDVLPLFLLADIVISDSSSAALETILVDKPLVLLDTVSGNEVAWKQHIEGEEFNGMWYSGALTHSESMEQIIKRPPFRVGEVVRQIEELGPAVEKILYSHAGYANNRAYLRNKLFSYNDGNCGKRAANIIGEFIYKEKPRPPLLSLAIRGFYKTRFKHLAFQIEQRDQELKLFREFKNEKTQLRKLGLLFRLLSR